MTFVINAGFSVGWVSAIDDDRRTVWIGSGLQTHIAATGRRSLHRLVRLLGDHNVSALNRTWHISPLNRNITEVHWNTRAH